MTAQPNLIPGDELSLLHENICKTLADPNRIQILYALSGTPLHVSAIAELMNTPQSTVSRHLSLLRQRGLVRAERDGANVLYSLAVPEMVEIIDSMRGILRRMTAERMGSLAELE
jgi:ArsR family transcriptional regulator